MQQRITLSQLETFLMKAANILRGSMDASECKEHFFDMLGLKDVSDDCCHWVMGTGQIQDLLSGRVSVTEVLMSRSK